MVILRMVVKNIRLKEKRKFYALTLKYLYTTRYPTQEDYMEHVDFMKEVAGIRVRDYSYELDKNDRLHYHALITSDCNLVYKGLQRSGMHVWVRRLDYVKDIFGWERYITKHFINQYENEQLVIANYMRHHYSFISDDEVVPRQELKE